MTRCIHCHGLISEAEKAAARKAAGEADESYVPPVACDDCVRDLEDARETRGQ